MTKFSTTTNVHLTEGTVITVHNDGIISFAPDRLGVNQLRIFPPLDREGAAGALWMAGRLSAAARALRAFHKDSISQPEAEITRMRADGTTRITDPTEPCTHANCPTWGCQEVNRGL